MRRQPSINSNLAEDPGVTEGNSIPAGNPARALSDDDERVATEIFAAAVDSMRDAVGRPEQQKVAACKLGMKPPHLSEYRNGVRITGFPRIVRGVRVDQEFAVAIIRALAAIAPGLEVRITKKRPADKPQLKKQMLLELAENPAMRRLVLASAAAKLGLDEVEAEEIWGEPTLVDAQNFIP